MRAARDHAASAVTLADTERRILYADHSAEVRARKRGRGFAVVAGEGPRLASRFAQSAKQLNLGKAVAATRCTRPARRA